MKKYNRYLIMFLFLASSALIQGAFAGNLLSQATALKGEPAAAKESRSASVAKEAKPVDPYAKAVTRRGSVVVVSKDYANLVRKDNALILSHVTVRQRVDSSGKVTSYEAVEVDKGSSLAKIGIHEGDQLVAVNGIPAKDLTANRQSLGEKNRFQMDLRRKGRPVRLIIEVR